MNRDYSIVYRNLLTHSIYLYLFIQLGRLLRGCEVLRKRKNKRGQVVFFLPAQSFCKLDRREAFYKNNIEQTHG